jgi:hypothetical protein
MPTLDNQNQCADPGYLFRIPDLKTTKKRGKNLLSVLFCSQKFYKNSNYFILEQNRKKSEPINKELNYLLPKKLLLSSQKNGLGFGIQKKTYSGSGSRGKKTPDPGSGSATLSITGKVCAVQF